MSDEKPVESKTGESKPDDNNGWSKLETVIGAVFDKKAKEYGWQAEPSKTSSENSTPTRERQTERKKGFLSNLFDELDL